MPRTPPYCRANPATPTPTPTAPPAHEWPLTHATTILPDPRALGLAVFWGGCAVACVVAYCAGGMP